MRRVLAGLTRKLAEELALPVDVEQMVRSVLAGRTARLDGEALGAVAGVLRGHVTVLVADVESRLDPGRVVVREAVSRARRCLDDHGGGTRSTRRLVKRLAGAAQALLDLRVLAEGESSPEAGSVGAVSGRSAGTAVA
ncbi:DUF6415 family natural product biosynthesis protein [Streptomyces sp. B1866]|uniref:DUF6415 family natural product biosynthesis protein n=1 Tax=Streptomyces sp. B1866 TaxID=3075431 RepID=UPI002890184A|nr:DUF6415 family natural product biosynthesis protein [Streptomyces sp. B1866]MDT3396318.1 DUF6415 family natural product biosynthesis protein [Streptomyces sp. B1866]